MSEVFNDGKFKVRLGVRGKKTITLGKLGGRCVIVLKGCGKCLEATFSTPMPKFKLGDRS
jgi:hypothetical protein